MALVLQLPPQRGRQLAHMVNMLYTTVTMTRSTRKLVAVRIEPEAWHQARVAAVTARNTLGRWLEEAIAEKIERDSETKRTPNS